MNKFLSIFCLVNMLIFVGSSISTAVNGVDEKAPTLSYAFNKSPEHNAIIKILKKRGEDQILQTANSIGMSQGKDFANVIIKYTLQDEPAEIELYLFKEEDTWVAYLELPTRKDHSAIFTTLARYYCKPLYKKLQSVSLIDDTWKSTNQQERTINIMCSELINNEWQDHRLTFVYKYDDKQGWHITGQSDTKNPSPKVTQKKSPSTSSTKPSRSKVKPKVTWGNAKTTIDEILKSIGGNPKPVFIMFGTTGQGFIQFHYVFENKVKDIQTVDWLNGKLSSPQASMLARPCPPIPFEDINFDLVTRIFDETGRKAIDGDMINVNLSRRFENGCHEPMWQGIASSGKHSLIITYSIDGKQANIEEYSF